MKAVLVALFLVLVAAANLSAEEATSSATANTTLSGSGAAAPENCGGCSDQAATIPPAPDPAPVPLVNDANGIPDLTTAPSDAKAAPVPAATLVSSPTLGAQSDLKAESGVIVPGVISDFKPSPLKSNSPLKSLNSR